VISLTPLLALLKPAPQGWGKALPWFRQVAGAAEFAQIRPDALPLPACWLIRAADRVRHSGERAEDVTLVFDAVIGITNVRHHAPGDTDDALLLYRRAVKTVLLGYALDGTQPIQFAGGQVIEYAEGDLYWRDRYEFRALIDNWLPDPAPFDSIQYTGDSL
jgi:hypothetical protein